MLLAVALCVVAIANVETVISIFPREYTGFTPPVISKGFKIVSNPASLAMVRQSKRTREGILLSYPGSRSPQVRRIDRTNVFRVRSNILDNLEERYYYRDMSLGCNGHDYFNKDVETLSYLTYNLSWVY